MKLTTVKVLSHLMLIALIATLATPANSASLSIRPYSLDFGTQAVGGASAPKSVTYTNYTRKRVTITAVASSSGSFSYAGSSLPVALNPGQSLTGSVTFKPAAAQAYRGRLTFAVSGGWNASLDMSGAGAATQTKEPVAIMVHPVSQTIATGQAATFAVSASGTGPLYYQWKKNGAAISNAFSSTYTTPAATSSDSGAMFSVTVTNSVNNVTSSAAVLTVSAAAVAPSITSQPASKTITAGQTATFAVSASGTAPLSYQWKKNNVAINGATAASYTTPAETTSDNAAQFTVTVSNSVNNVTSSAAVLTVSAAAVAPSITSQPASKTVTAGQTATFAVSASGTAPLSYQWKKNNVVISGATAASYTTPVTATSDNAAQFTVTVSNSVNNVTSSAAVLTVSTAAVAPSITSQPTGQTITAGKTATFFVATSGTAPLTYQWKKNNTSISGATSFSYTTPTETLSDNGAQFTVTVSNSVNSVTSSAATLTVNAAPAGVLSSSSSSLSFGSVELGTTDHLTTTLTNTGSASVTIVGVSVSGAGLSPSGVSNGLIINAGSTATLDVAFAPSAAGSISGNVTITSTASNPTLTVNVSGSGAQVVSHMVTLRWGASPSAVSGYSVYRSTVSGSSFSKVTSGLVTNMQFTDSSVQSGQTYYYVVRAMDSNNVESPNSNQAMAIVP